MDAVGYLILSCSVCQVLSNVFWPGATLWMLLMVETYWMILGGCVWLMVIGGCSIVGMILWLWCEMDCSN